MSHLQDRVVVITGAAGGFGRLMAIGCAERGGAVVVTDVDGAAVDGVASEITATGGRAIGVAADVTKRADMVSAVGHAVAAFGGVDVLVNNAGVMPLAFWADHAAAADAWDRCIDINVKGVVNGTSAVYDHMIERGRGHVVNISSIYGNHAVPGSAVYTATKAAVNILSDTLRQEARGRIKVTVVRPTGVVGTGLGGTVVNPAAIGGIVGVHGAEFAAAARRFGEGTQTDAERNPDDIGYWSVTPQDLVDQVLYAIDQPWGVVIADITVRASGEHYVL